MVARLSVRQSSFILSLCSLLFVFNACGNPIIDGLVPRPVPKPAYGYGIFLITFTQIEDSSIIDSFQGYTLNFTGTETLSLDRTNENLSDPVDLKPGVYSLTITAYMDTAKEKPAATGTLTGIEIKAGETTTSTVPLLGMTDGTGSFNWDIEFPDGLSEASMKITPLNAETGTPEQTLYFIGGAAPVGK